jgi:hypothetical protein
VSAKRKKAGKIPDDVKNEVCVIVERFNREHFRRDDCYYEAQFKGKYCYLLRSDYGQLGPICRLAYTGKIDDWEFAIFKWSSERYDPDEWMFPGSELVDGTVEGAMRAGLEAYRV